MAYGVLVLGPKASRQLKVLGLSCCCAEAPGLGFRVSPDLGLLRELLDRTRVLASRVTGKAAAPMIS